MGTLEQHALDAVTLVARERVCGWNSDPAYNDRKIIDVDVYIAGKKRGTWRHSHDTTYGLYLELLDRDGAMLWVGDGGGYSASIDTLKANTAELLVAGRLPTRRQYFERRAMVFLADNRFKIATVPLVVGLSYWLLR